MLFLIDNVELILKTVSNQHSVESQDNDQPDYDSVASDEDTDRSCVSLEHGVCVVLHVSHY